MRSCHTRLRSASNVERPRTGSVLVLPLRELAASSAPATAPTASPRSTATGATANRAGGCTSHRSPRTRSRWATSPTHPSPTSRTDGSPHGSRAARPGLFRRDSTRHVVKGGCSTRRSLLRRNRHTKITDRRSSLPVAGIHLLFPSAQTPGAGFVPLRAFDCSPVGSPHSPAPGLCSCCLRACGGAACRGE
jgi:hypothetical protein